jgi:membrane protein DedA with SNARE-associated domain
MAMDFARLREEPMIKEYVLDLVTNYGYYGLFISLVLGIVGLPIPDEILMTYCGFLVSQGIMSFSVTLMAAFAGSITGITISYVLGLRFGLPLIKRYGERIGITEERLEKVNQWYDRFGKVVLMIGYFIPGIRHVTAFAAGVSKMNFGAFALYAYTGGVVWAVTFITLGRTLGVHWTHVTELTHRFLVWLLLFLTAGGLVYLILVWRKKKNTTT